MWRLSHRTTPPTPLVRGASEALAWRFERLRIPPDKELALSLSKEPVLSLSKDVEGASGLSRVYFLVWM